MRARQSVIPGQIVNLALRHRALHACGNERRQAHERLLDDLEATLLGIVRAQITHELAVDLERDRHERPDACAASASRSSERPPSSKSATELMMTALPRSKRSIQWSISDSGKSVRFWISGATPSAHHS